MNWGTKEEQISKMKPSILSKIFLVFFYRFQTISDFESVDMGLVWPVDIQHSLVLVNPLYI